MLMTLTLTLACAADPLAGLTHDDRDAVSMLGPHVVQNAIDIAPVSVASDWLPLADSTNTYVRTSGDHAGDTETISLHGAATPPRGWTMRNPARWTRYLKHSDSGIHVPTTINVPHAVISHFSPPEPLLIPGAMPGDVIEHTLQVRVYDIHEPTVLAHSGTLTAHYRDLGGFRVQVPAGTFDTRLIKITYQGKVGPATITDSSWAFYAQGVGPVAFVNYKDVSAFLIYNKDERFGAVLKASKPSAAPTAP
ncbi:MAG: hypothetical protein QF733_10220 [Phycisphaerales bacterium]|nr:hypothetical protein [Phycisphaerales bacterium]